MLRFIPLVLANLRRKRIRTTMTVASIAVAFLLFGVLEALRAALSGGVQIAGQDRLITMNKVSMVHDLPLSRLQRIRATDGVTAATAESWFGGLYQEDKNPITAMAVTPDTFFQVYPEMQLSQQARHAWLAERSGVLIGKPLAYRFGWKVGDVIPLRSSVWVRSDGSNTWDVKVVGIFDYSEVGRDAARVFLRWDYFNETLPPEQRDMIGWVVLNVADSGRAVQIARAIDSQFANSAAETKTTTEQAFAQDYAKQVGDVGTIVVAVAFAAFFTMLLVTANTMGQSVRERTNELAVMKALGFASARVTLLVLSESILITALGGALGLGLAALISAAMGPVLQQIMPFAGVPTRAYIGGGVLIVALGALAGALPCIQAFQLQITEALRRA